MGIDAYSEAWSYDEVGNMISARKSSGATAPATTNYTYPLPGSPRPHAPTGTATASNQGEYVPLTVPARVMDTRYGFGQCDSPSYPCTTMGSGAGRELRLHGLGGLPANDADGVQRQMSAVAISITSVGSTGAGYIQMWPHGETAIYTSLLNYEIQPVSNTAIVTMSWNGELVVYNYGAQTDLVVDVLGYYTTTNGADGGTFKPLVGGRAVDTRAASRTGLCPDYTTQCTGLANGEVRAIRLTGRGGVPVSNVAAVAANFTVANLNGGGYLRVWAAGDPEPGTSNMNFTPSYANSQFAVVKVPPSGVINVRVVGSQADVIIDTQGYFTTPGNSTGTVETQAFTSARVLDTRYGTPLCAGSPTGALGACPPMYANNGRYIQITGQGGVPADAVAVTLNITFLGEGVLGAGTVWAADQSYPATTSMILRPGITASTVMAKLSANGRIAFSADVYGHYVVDVQGWYRAPAQATTHTWNANGQLVTRPPTAGLGTTYLAYDTQSRLCRVATVANPTCTTGGGTSFTYGPGGQRLIRTDPDGTKTLYLDGQELRRSNTGVLTATRYYTTGNATIAVRTTTGLHWLLGNNQGSASLTVANNATLTLNRQRYTPYGTPRGTPNQLDPITQRGYLGQTEDNETRLTYLNNRYYDPVLARFISTDPLAFTSNPATLNPYAYSGNNPTTYSDPTGLCYEAAEAGAVGVVVDCGQVQAAEKLGIGSFWLDEEQWSWEDRLRMAQFNAERSTLDLPNTTDFQAIDDARDTWYAGISEHASGNIARTKHLASLPELDKLDYAIAGLLLAGAGTAVLSGGAGATAYVQASILAARIGSLAYCVIEQVCKAPGPGTADDILGLADDYIDITAKGARVRNVQTSLTRSGFEQNLIDAGSQPTVLSQGKNVVSYVINGGRYVVRDAATSTGGPTADYYPAGSAAFTLKIRLAR